MSALRDDSCTLVAEQWQPKEKRMCVGDMSVIYFSKSAMSAMSGRGNGRH